MKKYLLLLSFFLLPAITSAAEIACTMEYVPVCGQPPMPKCQDGMMCAQVMPAPQTYGNSCMMKAAGATLLYAWDCTGTVPPPKACTKEFMPVCGMKQVQCIQAPCNPVRTDYGNRCMAEADGATDITGGTCIMSETPPIVWGDRDEHGCIPSAGYSWDDSMQSCIRSWEYQDKVDWAYNNKITRYTAISDFKYGNTLTRQEAAAFITRYLIEWLGRAEALCKLAYKDMDSIDTSLTPSISRACGLGVMHGNNGYFHPRFGLTRGEALAVLIRAIDQNKQDETVSPWYQGYLNRASVLGLEIASMKSFDEPITRGEFIEWLKALSENKNIGNDEVLLGAWKLERFSDTAGKSYTVVPTNLTFTADRFSIKFCNSMSGNYTAKNGSMTTDKVMSTMMACADDITTMLEWAFDMNGATYSIMMAKVTEGYTGSTEWLNLSTPLGANYTFGR